jgi:hypothetical protein
MKKQPGRPREPADAPRLRGARGQRERGRPGRGHAEGVPCLGHPRPPVREPGSLPSWTLVLGAPIPGGEGGVGGMDPKSGGHVLRRAAW